MKNKLIKSTLFAAVAAALAFAPAAVRAAETNAPATTETTPKKHGSLPFKGAVASVDAAAMTFTVGTQTFSVSSKTKITKDTTPATFADIAVGAAVSGSYKKDAEGKLHASSVKIKEAKAPKEHKKKEQAQ